MFSKKPYSILSCIKIISLITVCLINPLFAQDIDDISLESLLNIEISTAAKYDQTINEVPASVHVITAEDISSYGYLTIDQVLSSIPGFYSSYDRNYVYNGVRGFSRPTDYNNRILLLLDGHKMNENFYGSMGTGTFMGGINLNSIERIEIIHGPGSVLYGTGAMFAVINLISKNGNALDGVNLGAETGSYGRKKAWLTGGKEFDNGLELMLSGIWADISGQDLYFEEFDDPSTNNGKAKGLDWDKYSGLRFNLSYKDLTFSSFVTSRKKGIPTAPWETVFNEKGNESDELISFSELTYNYRINAAQSAFVKMYIDYYGYTGEYIYEDYDEDEGWYQYLWKDKNEGLWLGSEFRFQWDTHSNNRLISGVEYQYSPRAYYKEWDPWEATFDRNFEYSVFSAFIQDEYQPLNYLSFTAGLRYDTYSNMGGYTTPRFAVIYNPTESSTIKALYGIAFRVPSLYEKFYEDYEYGYKANPAIKQEQINTTELIWEQKINPYLFSTLSVFHYKLTDLIDQVIDPVDSALVHKNSKNVHAHGVEIGLRARFDNGLNSYINYSWQETKDALYKEKLTNSPVNIFKAGFYTPLFNLITLAADLRYESERITVYETKTNPFALVNINLSSRPIMDHLILSAKVQNLFDTKYQTPGGWEHVQPAITQDGRNYVFRVQYQF